MFAVTILDDDKDKFDMSLTTYYCIKLALLQYQATLNVQIRLVFRSIGTENQDRLHTKVQVLYAIYATEGCRPEEVT